MDFKTIAEFMYPSWILGILVIGSVIRAGHKHLLRIEKEPVLKWILFLILVTAIRLFLFTFLGYSGITGPPVGLMMIPWTAAFTVFWEDACHGLPLVLLNQLIGNKNRWTKSINLLATIITSIAFGMSHLYQGFLVALLLCLYVPYSIKYGKQYGFGTVIVCHTLFDLVTFLFVKYFICI